MFSELRSRLIPTRRRVVVYIAVFLGILLLRLVLDLWAGAHLRSVSDRIAPAYGGRLDAASLSPPAVAPGENRARIISAAAALTTLQNDGRRRDALMQALTGMLPGDPGKRIEVLRQAVIEYRLALMVLDELESRPKANWEIEYADGFRMRLPSLREIRDLSSVNAATGLVALADGNADEAARRARLGLAVAGSLAWEPNLLIQLIHIAAAGTQARLIRDVLAGGEPSREALEPLAERLEESRATDPVVTGLAGQLKVINGTLGAMESGAVPRDPRADHDGFWSRALVWGLRPAVRLAHARTLNDLDLLIQYARLQPYERDARKLQLPSDEPQPWWWRKISPMILGGLGRAVRSGDEHRAILTLASTAVALRRCRLERGSYPESLDELAPVFLSQAPVDPFTGRAPEYTRSGAGFELRVSAPPNTQDATKGLLRWDIPR
jgi:hypothetical protein